MVQLSHSFGLEWIVQEFNRNKPMHVLESAPSYHCMVFKTKLLYIFPTFSILWYIFFRFLKFYELLLAQLSRYFEN